MLSLCHRDVVVAACTWQNWLTKTHKPPGISTCNTRSSFQKQRHEHIKPLLRPLYISCTKVRTHYKGHSFLPVLELRHNAAISLRVHWPEHCSVIITFSRFILAFNLSHLIYGPNGRRPRFPSAECWEYSTDWNLVRFQIVVVQTGILIYTRICWNLNLTDISQCKFEF